MPLMIVYIRWLKKPVWPRDRVPWIVAIATRCSVRNKTPLIAFMAGVFSSEDPIPSRTWFHNVSLDGVPQSSMVAMRRVMEQMSSLEDRVGGESVQGRMARRRRAEDDLGEHALHLQPVAQPQAPEAASHRGPGSTIPLPAPAPPEAPMTVSMPPSEIDNYNDII